MYIWSILYISCNIVFTIENYLDINIILINIHSSPKRLLNELAAKQVLGCPKEFINIILYGQCEYRQKFCEDPP